MSEFEKIVVIYYVVNTALTVIDLALKYHKNNRDKKAAQDSNSLSD